jgi:predicted RNA-binding protein YlqC (UPF0109 family)
VAPSDLGKVIGKDGRTARAIRTVLSAASARLNKRAVLEILDCDRDVPWPRAVGEPRA